MILHEIIKGTDIKSVIGRADVEVKGVAYNSKEVMPGCLFVAVRGENVDGHDFIWDAVGRGAAAIVCEEEPMDIKPEAASVVCVKDSRTALAAISNNLYGKPSESLFVIGVTGTNGKTTTTYLIKSILESWGKKVGLIGTIQYMIGDETHDAQHTTPEALEFQGLLYRMRMSGCKHVVSEVSSHALAQKRVDGTLFRTAVFTNLTREHLDFHRTMEDYYLAKERLFNELLSGDAVINYDDQYGKRLISDIKGLRPEVKRLYTYGLENGSDFMATEIRDSFDKLYFKILSDDGIHKVESSLMGLPNVYNILSAAVAAVSIGVPWDVILKGIRDAKAVKGRFERVDAGQRFLAIVDYAHTEDALERLIYTARGLTEGKIITVFGCGGDRDAGKRPKMGAVATRLSDFVVITTDNPRSEAPEKIINEIVTGVARKNYLIEPDRKEAIRRAVLMAGDNDVVLVAGKGHESSQVVSGRSFHFSDREVLEEAIKQLVGND